MFGWLQVRTQIKGFACSVEVCQSYTNTTDSLMDAIYKFPLDALCAVTGFVAEIEGKKIVAKCMQKEKAKQVYQGMLLRECCCCAAVLLCCCAAAAVWCVIGGWAWNASG